MKRFYLLRKEDASGVSGTGRVAEGIAFSDGRAVINWCIANPMTKVASLVIYDSIPDLIAIHGHEGRTTIEWIDDNNVPAR